MANHFGQAVGSKLTELTPLQPQMSPKTNKLQHSNGYYAQANEYEYCGIKVIGAKLTVEHVTI